MDPSLAELSRLADNALLSVPTSPPSRAQISRYNHLFHYTATIALSHLTQQRADPTHIHVPPALWSSIEPFATAAGYDREAYEHALHLERPPFALPPTSIPASSSRTHGDNDSSEYVFKLEPPLGTPAAVQAAAHLPTAPSVLHGAGENGPAQFCTVDRPTRRALEAYLSARSSPLRPTFIAHSLARKALDPASAAPTLGVEATLPQHRAASTTTAFLPAQGQYPVWYFFYGTLAEEGVLAAQLGWGEGQVPLLREARVRGGEVRVWGAGIGLWWMGGRGKW
ncbi:hypothetical protein MMC34_000292 [Xylographa carneopallida]|nr:hypothetical protein [Xylographa carneopallida]